MADFKGFYAWIDTETGGLNPKLNPVLQVALIITDDLFNTMAGFCSYVRPADMPILSDDQYRAGTYVGPYISTGALAVNGITPAELSFAPSELKVLTIMECLIDEYKGRIKFAGYNCDFDIGMLAAMESRNDIKLAFVEGALDLLPIARQQLRLSSHKLTHVAQHYGLETTGAHDAFVDTKLTVEIARRLFE